MLLLAVVVAVTPGMLLFSVGVEDNAEVLFVLLLLLTPQSGPDKKENEYMKKIVYKVIFSNFVN